MIIMMSSDQKVNNTLLLSKKLTFQWSKFNTPFAISMMVVFVIFLVRVYIDSICK